MKSRYTLLLALGFLLAPQITNAQYWRALPALSRETSQILSFSQDEKYVIYKAEENGVSNIYRVAAKGGAAPEAITSFADGSVLRPISTIGKNWVVFMRPTAGNSDH